MSDRKRNGARGLAVPLVLALGLGASLVGCSDRSGTMPAVKVLRISPADGATGVRLDSPVVLDFGVPVTRSTAERGFHLISESDMQGSCPVSSMGPHGTMDSIMNDPAMLAHMDEYHATHGRYDWNSAGTVCTFKPDTLMAPGTRYMAHMSGEMLDMMERMGGGMMDGGMSPGGDMMVHFQTMASDEHAGHH